jgi:hypothetical protein
MLAFGSAVLFVWIFLGFICGLAEGISYRDNPDEGICSILGLYAIDCLVGWHPVPNRVALMGPLGPTMFGITGYYKYATCPICGDKRVPVRCDKCVQDKSLLLGDDK